MNRSGRRRGAAWAATAARSLLATVLATTVLTGCGVPTDNTIHPIDPAASPRHAFTPPTPTDSRDATLTPHVYFTTDAGRLMPAPRAIDAGAPETMLQAVLTQLTAGPASTELAAGLGTALPPTMTLEVVTVLSGLASVAVTGEQLPSTDQTTAVAQIVLSATSVAGIDSVQLTLDGKTMDAPLTDGALTYQPLTAADYRRLVTTPTG